MTAHFPAPKRAAACSLAATLLLAGCGGGGSDPPPAPVAIPTSGTYSWLLKARGPTASAFGFAVSLIHPAEPTVEFTLEPDSDQVTDARMVVSGSVDAAGRSVSALRPHALVYIVGGDVRRASLIANGTAPRDQIDRARTTSACRFVIEANDYADPERSRFIVSTAGADGACDTTDDGRGEVVLSATPPRIALNPLAAPAPLAMLRDRDTLAPRAWLLPTRTLPWSASEPSLTYRTDSDAVTRVVANSDRAALVESPSGLALIDFPDLGTFRDTPLAPPSPARWESIGYDAPFFYAWRNLGDRNGSWQLLRAAAGVSNPAVFASGAGQVSIASLGRDQIYLTVFAPSSNQLLRLPKAVPGVAPQLLEDAPTTTGLTVLTSATDVHQVWRVTGLGSAAPVSTIDIIDEAGTRLFVSAGSGWPLVLSSADTIRLDASENRTRFVFADRYGSRGFGDATLTSFDAVTRRTHVLGTIPGASDFGSDFVFAGVNASTGPFLAGFAARSSGGVVQAAGTRAFSFDATRDGSLRTTTRQQ